MKRCFRMGVLLLAAVALPRLPSPFVEIGRLEPAEVLWLAQTREGIVLQTDTGRAGFGETMEIAVAELKAGSASEVFLGSVDHLLVDVTGGIPGEVMAYLRPGCRVCWVSGPVDLTEAARYLSRVEPDETLNSLRAGEILNQTLTMREGKWHLG